MKRGAESREARTLSEAAAHLREAERPVRVLRTLEWGPEVARRFFAAGERELPRARYRPLDPAPVLERLAAARALIDGDSPGRRLLRRTADRIEGGARMLEAVGTREFHRWSVELYGAPDRAVDGAGATPLDLAARLDETLAPLHARELGIDAGETLDAEELAERLRTLVARGLRGDAPEVVVVDDLSANALAGPGRIRVRRGAMFSERDVVQLYHHEALVHVATALNGRAQERLPILAAGHPGTTRTQEGLAVFAEMISGAMDPDRLLRLADRTIAIQAAIDGADFLDLYQLFLERGTGHHQAFENARRVVRGGLVEGGAPFTKDSVYLDGLVRVHDFLRVAVETGRTDALRILFAGKLALEDVPDLLHLYAEGLVRMPRHLPAWLRDPGFLVCTLAFSAFIDHVELDGVRARFAADLTAAPRASDR